MKDRFSTHSQQYAQFRPTYPDELYQFIFSHVKNFDCAWDAGTGNGQAAQVLATHFKKVFATDISQKQLDRAQHSANIAYSVAKEQTSFSDQSIDLITVAQAAHWFEMPRFCAEVKRVAKPEGILAIWGYSLLQINQAIDPLVTEFYSNVIGPYWDPERTHIDDQYARIHFPFDEIECPTFFIRVPWTLTELEGYLNTWTAVRQYISTHQQNPVDSLIKQIEPRWKQRRQTVTFPLFLRLARVHPGIN